MSLPFYQTLDPITMAGSITTAGASGGLVIPTGAPTPTTTTLYQVSGTLYWNGTVVATGSTGGFTRNAVSDANYTITGTGNQIIAYTTLTAARTVTLPAATTAGQTLTILDETGNCTWTKALTINRAGTDKIHDATATSISIWAPRGGVTLVSNGTNTWVITARFPSTWYVKWLTGTTFVWPPDLLHAIVACQGGGGGGGGGNTTNRCGGSGGSSGVYAKNYVTGVSANTSITVTVGTGGNAGTSGDGTAGGDSSFSTYSVGKGGAAGKAATGSGNIASGVYTTAYPTAHFIYTQGLDAGNPRWMGAAPGSISNPLYNTPTSGDGASGSGSGFDNTAGTGYFSTSVVTYYFNGGTSVFSSGASRSGGGGAASLWGAGGNGAYNAGTPTVATATTANTGAGGGGSAYDDPNFQTLAASAGATGFVEIWAFF